MANLPIGTVTFLFTGVESDPPRLRLDEEPARSQLDRQAEIAQTVFNRWNGCLFKTIGHGYCVVFQDPLDAIQAAFELQREMLRPPEPAGEPHLENIKDDFVPATRNTGLLKIRLAVHSGTAELRNNDYFGPALNRVARLLGAAHGGQTLVSRATAELVRERLSGGLDLIDLNEHRLKDLSLPEHIYQLAGPGLPAEFPPLRTLDHRPTNLPSQPTPLIGREKDIAALVAGMQQPGTRLLTLTGPGGTGKTRLALQVAAELLEQFVDGVYFVGLAAVNDPELLGATIAQTLGIKESGPDNQLLPARETLKRSLADQKLLLVLDNFEHLMEAAPLLTWLLGVAPGLKLLVTSREVLRLYGEQEYPVSPLGLPAWHPASGFQNLSVEDLARYEAVKLFVQRTQAVRPDFRLTPENAAQIAEICLRLDGLPLAIELAAARIRHFQPATLLARLSGNKVILPARLGLLTGGARNLPARQQTLRGAIDWSYQLLSRDEKRLFQRLGIFVGSCALEAIEAVCNSADDLDLEIINGITSLVDKSLLRQEEDPELDPWFWMLETLREYALERLQQEGNIDELRLQHARYYLELAEKAEPQLKGPHQARWARLLEREHDNFRAALRWLFEAPGQPAQRLEEAARMAGALGRFWYTRGYLIEGRRWLETIIGRLDELPLQTTRNTYLLPAAFLSQLASPQSIRAKIFSGAGLLAYAQGDYGQAAEYYRQSLELSRSIGDEAACAFSLNSLGLVHLYRGECALATGLFEESLPLYRELNNQWGIAVVLNNLGFAALYQGDYAGATAYLEESLAIHRQLGEKRGSANALNNLAYSAINQDIYHQAAAFLEESLVLKQEMGDKEGIAWSLEGAAALAVRLGQPGLAATLLGAAASLRQIIGAPLPPVTRPQHRHTEETIRAQLTPEEFQQAWETGRRLKLEEAIQLALNLSPAGAA